ncbi:MAG: NACHT domain-containing protein [Bacteroidota bacterium]
MKSKSDKIQFLQSFTKEVQVHSLLADLLPEMGFDDVKITHEKGNKPEFGKDVICSRFDKIEGKKDWYAFVVKKGKVSGSSGVVKEIEDQVYECFKYPYKSLEQTKKIPINKVKVVTNFGFSSGAKDKIFEANNDDRANIDFWDCERLVYFIDEYYPKYWIQGSKRYKEYIARLLERTKFDSVLKSLNIDDKKAERFLSSLIEPKLMERVTDSDGSIDWVQRSSNTVISLPNNSIIIGEPGCGKSTLFKTLSTEIVTQNSLRNDTEFYPIIINFRDIEASKFDLIKAIEGFFSRDWNKDLAIDYSEILDKNSCVIFIDALDEIAKVESKEKALKSIEFFNTKYPNIKVICSSRPSDYLFYNCETAGFRYIEIKDLNYTQVESFLNNYFGENIIRSKSLLKSLQDSEILEKLPKTPLTIALITMLFDEKEVEIPATISDLYDSFVNLLIGKATSTTDLIEIGIKQRVLCHIAKHLHINLKNSLSKSELLTLVKEYSKERGQALDVQQVLDEILDRVGLLYVNDKDEVLFKHQSFQEYFTAYEIFHHRQSDRHLFIDNFNDLWWQNVAIFFAGMSKDSPKLLDDILEKSEPLKLSETIVNISGIGKLLQALYNTPIENRIKGVRRGLNGTTKTIHTIEKDNSEDAEFWKNFSKYGLLQIFGGWFKYSYWSITLKEALGSEFDNMFDRLSDDLEEDDRLKLEFQLFLASSILASEEFVEFDRLEKLVNSQDLSNIHVLATIDMHYRKLLKALPKSFRKNDSIKTIGRRIEKKIHLINSYPDINTPINQLGSK